MQKFMWKVYLIDFAMDYLKKIVVFNDTTECDQIKSNKFHKIISDKRPQKRIK